MGWQQKGSMRLYNSLSGIGWLVGVLSKSICDVQVMCKACGICEAARNKFTPVGKHDCHVNHTGSSKSMAIRQQEQQFVNFPLHEKIYPLSQMATELILFVQSIVKYLKLGNAMARTASEDSHQRRNSKTTLQFWFLQRGGISQTATSDPKERGQRKGTPQ